MNIFLRMFWTAYKQAQDHSFVHLYVVRLIPWLWLWPLSDVIVRQQFEYSNYDLLVCMIPGSCKFPDSRSTCSWCFHKFVYDGANQVLVASGAISKWLLMGGKWSQTNVWCAWIVCFIFFFKGFFCFCFFLICTVCINVCFVGNVAGIYAVYHIALCSSMKWLVCVQLLYLYFVF